MDRAAIYRLSISSTAKLIALEMQLTGVTKTSELHAATGIPASTIRRAKAELRAVKFVLHRSEVAAVASCSEMSARSEMSAPLETERSEMSDGRSIMSDTLTGERSPVSAARSLVSAEALGNERVSRARIESPLRGDTSLEEDSTKLASLENHSAREEPAESDPLASLNGSADLMIDDVVGWMHGGGKLEARKWLASQIAIYGQAPTKDAWSKLKTDIASGDCVARPLQAWCKIAQRLREAGAKPSAGPQKKVEYSAYSLKLREECAAIARGEMPG